ncbi:hypothetical protein MK489_21825 [Myxococcota bacterium]|nr:hypothetical protein [Myxococcota bacterium]
MEAIFSRLGLAAAGISALVLVLCLDVWLTPDRGFGDEPSSSVFDMYLVTSDGRPVSDVRWGVPLALSPTTVYANLPERKTSGYDINSLGLRGPEVQRVPQGPRVISVGGSTAFGMLVEYGDVYSSLLGRVMGVEVLNAGVIGFLSTQELGLVVSHLIDLAPNLIVVLDGWNDLYDAYWWERFGDGRDPRPGTNVNFHFMENRLVDLHAVETSVPASVAQAARTLVRKSTLLSGIARLLRRERPAREPPGPASPWMDAIVDGYVRNIVKLRDFSGTRGAELLLVLQPEIGQLLPEPTLRSLAGDFNPHFFNGDEYWAHVPALYREFRKRASKDLQAQGVELIDASSAFRRYPDVRELFQDPVHLSARGHELLAALVRVPAEKLLSGRAMVRNSVSTRE